MKKSTRRERAAAKRKTSDEAHAPRPSGNGPLIRNLLIIALLIVSIAIVWKERERRLAARAIQQQRQNTPPPIVADPRPKPEAQPKPEAEAIAEAPEKPPEPAPRPKPIPEATKPESAGPTPAQSLLALREKLAAGKRESMPLGTMRHGDSFYFLVTTPMTWVQAQGFAGAYGGHLPIASGADRIDWLKQQFPAETSNDPARSSLWLGARNHKGKWHHVDGSPMTEIPRGEGLFAALQADGSLRARSETDLHPFFIQWQADGSNPASLRALLARTKKELSKGNPDSHPPGTVTLGNRHLLILAQATNALEARELASIAGGRLMTSASYEEADWLEQTLAAADFPEGIWLGASQRDGEWTWDSGEAWTFARWDPATPPGDEDSALRYLPRHGWQAAAPSANASGLVIEWSNESRPAPIATQDEHDDFLTTVRSRLAVLEKQRDAALLANAKTLVWNLDTWLRTNNKSEFKRWQPRVADLKARIQRGRVPIGLPPAPNAAFSPRMLKSAKDAAAKQHAIQVDFIAKATRIRDAHLVRIRQNAKDEEKRGQIALARRQNRTADQASDLKAWLQTLGVDPNR
ncbi:MAG: hypothetical protein EAZ65_02410 [Verrucomicrobia bacterium]|nr:MAG: hypothetical protein EAZ84_04670 [Verrucomicrobiota bacterium]TAE88891.1 MAG: hypothetical protein EAZ82_02315 [Verrucomicrobiota bacterium]TAF27308.1 MAG: hypothetical protein EAZ71_02280 [Verrucomicrobiota bacterium]TAF42401.1 MAG: hypothetical protein EAZ65_02410 [Verrucomicrobiota bacterium]